MSLEPAQRDLSDNDIRIWFWQRICGIGLGLRIRSPHLAPDRFGNKFWRLGISIWWTLAFGGQYLVDSGVWGSILSFEN